MPTRAGSGLQCIELFRRRGLGMLDIEGYPPLHTFLVSLNKSSIDMTSFLSLAHYFATNFGATPRVIKGTEEGPGSFYVKTLWELEV